MKQIILLFALMITTHISAQTVIEYDYMETSSPSYLTAGWFIPAATTGWFNNASVSATNSAAIYGLGNGTSGIEQDWYVLPNVTGLNPSKQYQLRFRLASYTFSNSTATTRGVDVADIVDVQVSTNGGVNYISELRITGNSNARWDYNATGIITHTANGTFTNSAAPAGDVYQAPAGISTTGPSTISLDLPSNITQVAIDILCRVNSAGEEWWIDNIELIELYSLPIELVTFEGVPTNKGNILTWKTASESNTDYYLIEHSINGEFDENSVIGQKLAAGNSSELLTYSFTDNNFQRTINYYQLTQVDKDGQFKTYGPIAIDNTLTGKTLLKIVNLLGQEVDAFCTGVLFEIYTDGTSKKIIR